MSTALPNPECDHPIEMWFRDMNIMKPGVVGVFHEGKFRSHDLADHYEEHEVKLWKYQKPQEELASFKETFEKWATKPISAKRTP